MPRTIRGESYFSNSRLRELLPSVARIAHSVFAISAVERRRNAALESAAQSAAPNSAIESGDYKYRMAFARIHARCSSCGCSIQAGSYRPRIYVGDVYADLCNRCARVFGARVLVRHVDRVMRKKRPA